MGHPKRKVDFQPSISSFHVSLRECTWSVYLTTFGRKSCRTLHQPRPAGWSGNFFVWKCWNSERDFSKGCREMSQDWTSKHKTQQHGAFPTWHIPLIRRNFLEWSDLYMAREDFWFLNIPHSRGFFTMEPWTFQTWTAATFGTSHWSSGSKSQGSHFSRKKLQFSF